MSTLKIIVADDHPMFSEGLAMIISRMPGMELIGTASNGLEVLQMIAHNTCDLVIIDVHMPVMDGIETTHQIKVQYPKVQVIALSMNEDPDVIKKIIYAGASGYLPKYTNKDELKMAIDRVMNGESYLHEAFIRPKAASDTRVPVKKENELALLTDREIEILCLISCEKSNYEIAEQLFIAQSTVETHRKNLIKKLQVKNSLGLLKVALKHGLIDLK